MKTIGLLGGMSWESTVTYYQFLNRMAREKLGGLHSAQCLIWSFDFAEIEAAQASGDWDRATDMMVNAARQLERGGADCLVICTNTMHKMAGDVEASVNIPLLHIADATAPSITENGCKTPLLLATGYTMEQDFYKGNLKDIHGIDVRVPDADDRTEIHRIIYEELCKGEIWADSKQTLLEIVAKEHEAGADGVIFGCTEIGLLVSADDFSIPSFDTTTLHARAALKFALETG
ncbi:aspartate/glutamate racemase family protein [Roseibium album]|uniref:Putative amino-acid racemase n=1 Tax=Roseibium album TaxID=311410 RepID=A0A0M6ZTE6_9HYPH|nr:aspartate/glutamate racemase family protein [Roseibium album]CTQ59331.1 putative amino-acid racemase [Roseibium album]CTQ64784.1 putative amino-acid racemase [Roseibium album]CTQ74695.1 putative amino-acid racemase [Roseibium album]